MKAKKFLSTIAILFIALISGCANDDVVEVDGVCPIVISTIPVDGASGVPLNQIVTATFNEEMNPSTIDQSSFTITVAGVPVAGTVTYSGKTATFTPASRLTVKTLYTGRITTAVKDVDGNALQTDYVWTFTTDVNPIVVSTNPANLAVDVALNKIITATFNMSMNPLTINATTFTVKQGTTTVLGTITYAGTMATFTPSAPLAENTVYTGTITKGATNLAGTELASDYVWTFKTGITPLVISTDPTRDATGVALDKVISATFNMPMNPLTLNATTYTVKQNGIAILGTIAYSGSTVSFTPAVPLLNNTVYTATITTGAANTVGATLAADYTWSFTTVDLTPFVVSTDPMNDEKGVALNKVIRATFNMPMNASTLNGTTFTVRQGTTVILGSVSYTGLTASFTPNSPLEGNKVYTATITTGAKNVNGTALATDYVWSFTTDVRPIVIARDPSPSETKVPLNKVISATFNMPMNPLTLNAATFTVKQNGIAILGTINSNPAGTTFTFTPNNSLAENTVYTVTITTEAQNTFGTGLASNDVWTFTTLSNIPIVIDTDPNNNETGVALNKVISATFDMPMNPLTLNAATFTVKNGAIAVLGTYAYSNSGKTVSFTPSTPLAEGTVYTATITTGAQNNIGTGLAANYVWNFTTLTATLATPIVISTDPARNETGVALNKVISATFNMPMNPLTLNATTFTVKQNGIAILGLYSYSGSTVYFTPASPLAVNTVYTATITTGAQSTAGKGLASDYTWNFTTLNPIVPPTAGLAFGVFGGDAGVTNQGLNTMVYGKLGTTGAATKITGFTDLLTGRPYTVTPLNNGGVTRGIFTADQTALDGLNEATALYLSISPASRPGGTVLLGELGGLTLAPATYTTTSSFSVTNGDLVLDAKGDANAKWYFQAPSSLTVGDAQPSSVKFLNGVGNPANVYWYVGTAAVINYAGGGVMVGNIISTSGVTLSSPANSTTSKGQETVLNGRAISLVAAVTMVNTIINVPN